MFEKLFFINYGSIIIFYYIFNLSGMYYGVVLVIKNVDFSVIKYVY